MGYTKPDGIMDDASKDTTEENVAVIRRWLVGDIDKRTGKPVNGIIHRLMRIETRQTVLAAIVAFVAVAAFFKLNASEIADVVRLIIHTF